MIASFTFVMLVLAFAMAIPVLFLAIQTGAALLPARKSVATSLPRHLKVAVVMPAHNEEAAISKTIHSIVTQLPPTGRLLVVDDNCIDGRRVPKSRFGRISREQERAMP
mgnify:CR=1 FL=1